LTPMRVLRVLSLLVLFVCVAACSNPVNKTNYDKLAMGMDYQEVVALLGPPDQSQTALGATSCVWGKPPRTISVKFIADKVVFFTAENLK
jgi:hypothetical protein